MSSRIFLALSLLLFAGIAGAREVTIVTEAGRLVFEAELAGTPAERGRGLMHRRDLAAGHGMLFTYESPRPVVMWMKNTPLPLDMVFVAGDCRVLRVHRAAEPFSTEHIPSGGAVRYVLEVNAGEASAVRAGDRLILEGCPEDVR